ncbi:MAG: RagB/SusD family nutrient uptake outer membrane protein [Prevotellaceae bacterium]|jgi:hypothetical protein|nr:RagB/SusD family nutrient uptake outer membrane protein [Prevotellaceae bacterium]
MKQYLSTILCALALLFTASCGDFLERPSMTTMEDDTYWTGEENIRLYANDFYTYFFVGYGVGYTTTFTPHEFTFDDNHVINSTQTNFTRSVPTSKGSTSFSVAWESQYTGPSWNFSCIRKVNIMIDRITQQMPGLLSTDAYNHWLGVGRFFRGLEYARLVNVFGDVPYYGHEVSNTDKDELYKDRTPRNDVMDSVYNDFQFAMNNVRTSGDAQTVSRYVVAAFVSRWALIEGTWQKYREGNNTRANMFFDLAISAAQIVMNSGKYDIVTPFRDLFCTNSATAESILYRKYDAAVGVTHCIATNYSLPSTTIGPNLDLIKAFICTDGLPYQQSTLANASDFTLSNVVKTRDSRFEGSFYTKPHWMNKASYLCLVKFCPRDQIDKVAAGGSTDPAFQGSANVTGYPVIRYAEVLLNYMEAKAEKGEATQSDIDLTINKIRNRPLDPAAVALGIAKTAPMQLNALPDDPARDLTVPALIWEVRRERRMEFVQEFSRIIDLRRWGKLNYMDTDANPELMMGTWVNFSDEAPGQLTSANVGKIRVQDKSGNLIDFDGKNGASLKGFFYPPQNLPRLPYLDTPNINIYLSPIGINQIKDYDARGYKLTQTVGWPSDIQ